MKTISADGSRVARLRAPFNEEGEAEEEGDGRRERAGGHLLSRSMSGSAGKGSRSLSLNARGISRVRQPDDDHHNPIRLFTFRSALPIYLNVGQITPS